MIKKVSMCLVFLVLIGCQSPQPPCALCTFIPVEDITRIPQDPLQWPRTLDPQHHMFSSTPGKTAQYQKRFFAPWHRTLSHDSQTEVIQNARQRQSQPIYGPNLRPYHPSMIQEWQDRACYTRMNTFARQGILVRDSDVRVFPSHLPCFKNPCTAGEGYPFDQCQNDRLYVGTPVYISHFSTDQAWAYVLGARSQGWVPSLDIALVNPQEAQKIESSPLVTFVRDKKPLYDRNGHFLAYVALGTQVPLKAQTSQYTKVSWPIRGAKGHVAWETVQVDASHVATKPLSLTSDQAVNLLHAFSGQFYGWGTYLGYRDCSALMKDYFAVFHIFLPRNSKAQSLEGRVISLQGLSPLQKKETVLAQGVPFRTLLYVPGHISLYVGAFQSEPVMIHAVWGNKTTTHGQESRNIIGHVATTTLEWGKEISDIPSSSLFIHRLERMSVF